MKENLIAGIPSALGGAGLAGGRAGFKHHLYDGAILTDPPIGDGTGRHADFRTIERVADALDEGGSIEEAEVCDPIACLRARMALLYAPGQGADRIYFYIGSWPYDYLHVHGDVSCNRPETDTDQNSNWFPLPRSNRTCTVAGRGRGYVRDGRPRGLEPGTPGPTTC